MIRRPAPRAAAVVLAAAFLGGCVALPTEPSGGEGSGVFLGDGAPAVCGAVPGGGDCVAPDGWDMIPVRGPAGPGAGGMPHCTDSGPRLEMAGLPRTGTPGDIAGSC